MITPVYRSQKGRYFSAAHKLHHRLQRKEIALVTAGILTGITVSSPATQVAGPMVNPSSQRFYVNEHRINLIISTKYRAVRLLAHRPSYTKFQEGNIMKRNFSCGELRLCLQRESHS